MPSLAYLQELMWQRAGIIRNSGDLEYAANLLSNWQSNFVPTEDQASFELSHLIVLGRLLTEAALVREESRGSHLRHDFPNTSPQWQCRIIMRKDK